MAKRERCRVIVAKFMALLNDKISRLPVRQAALFDFYAQNMILILPSKLWALLSVEKQ